MGGTDRISFAALATKGTRKHCMRIYYYFPGWRLLRVLLPLVHYGVPWNLSSAISLALGHPLAPAPFANLAVGFLKDDSLGTLEFNDREFRNRSPRVVV